MYSVRYFDKNRPNDFHPADFPEVVTEIAELKGRLRNLQQPDNDLVIISYARDHSIRSDLAKSHAALVDILRSKGSCAHLENIFLISRGNTKFRTSLENFLKSEINTSYSRHSHASYHPNGDPKFDI